jgi:hypothetical protein
MNYGALAQLADTDKSDIARGWLSENCVIEQGDDGRRFAG